MKTVILLIFSFGVMAFGKTELNCTAKSSAMLTADTAKTRSLAAHKALSNKPVKNGKHQR